MKGKPQPRPHVSKGKPVPRYFAEPTKRERSIEQEDRFADALDGKRNPGSGSWGFRPGDVRADELLLETKTTKRETYTLSIETLTKVYFEAARLRLDAAFGITFESAHGIPKDWIVLPLSVFQGILARKK